MQLLRVRRRRRLNRVGMHLSRFVNVDSFKIPPARHETSLSPTVYLSRSALYFSRTSGLKNEG